MEQGHGQELQQIKKVLAIEMDFGKRPARISRLERKLNVESRKLLNLSTNVVKQIGEKR